MHSSLGLLGPFRGLVLILGCLLACSLLCEEPLHTLLGLDCLALLPELDGVNLEDIGLY